MRRETSPSAGSTHERRDVPLALGEVARPGRGRPCAASGRGSRRQDGEARDRHGDDAADHGAEAERRALEELAAREPRSGCGAARPLARRPRPRRRGASRLAPLRLDGDRLPAQLGGRVARPEDSRRRSAIAAPIVEIQSGLMIRPTRTTTTPIAKPIGHRVGEGRCGSSWSDSCSVSGLGCSGSTRSKSYRKRGRCERRTNTRGVKHLGSFRHRWIGGKRW